MGRQIAKAIAQGQPENLEVAGQPLRHRAGQSFTDMAMQVATRIVAGALPEGFKIKKLLAPPQEAYASATTDADRFLAMAVIADREQRYHIAIEARRAFMKP